MSKVRFGPILIFITLVITSGLYFFSKSSSNYFTDFPLLSLGQIFGLWGTVLLVFSFILSGRFRFLEDLFGGLDKVYRVHHLVGGIGFALLINHPLMFIVDRLPNQKLALMYLIPGADWSYNFGIFALFVFAVLIVLTIFVNLPYHVWKKTHEYMGLPFLLAAIHIYFINSDTSRFLPLRFWMLVLLWSAIVSFIYKRFLYNALGPRRVYLVDRLDRKPDVIDIYLKPVHDNLGFYPGQFAFVGFKEEGVEAEPHPFSISSLPTDNLLRFSSKIVGDYTLSLRNLKIGTKAVVYGPYGRLSEKYYAVGKEAIFIAGGIGVTPFLGMVRKLNKNGKIILFYCTKDRQEAYYHDELSQTAQETEGLAYELHCSSEKGRITAEKILQKVESFKDKQIFICGPQPMMESLRDQLLKFDVKPGNIMFEDFGIK